MNKNLILFHDNCTDGMMSAILLYLYFKEIGKLQETEFIAVNYNQPIPDVTGCHVYIVDFSYSKEVLEAASLTAACITMLDHHLTASQQWGGYKRFKHQCGTGCEMHLTIEEHKSGAGLTYDWIKDNVTLPSILFNPDDDRITRVTNAVQDRDLWQFKLEKTKEIYEALSILPKTFDAWVDFLTVIPYSEFEQKIAIAGHYLDVKEKLAQDYASKYQMTNFFGHMVPLVNVPANMASRVCEILATNHPFAVSYCLSKTDIFISLRSNVKTGIDVSAIAKRLNGGGHFNASGAKISTEWFHYFINGKLESIETIINKHI